MPDHPPPAQTRILIRPLSDSDLRAYVQIRLEALRDHPTSFGTCYEDQSADSDETWLARIRPALEGAHARIFLADAAPGPAGLLGVFREPGTKVRHSATLYSVYVRPPYRGKGVIDQLVNAAVEWCRQRDVTILRLNVTTTNHAAIHCYRRLGFETTGLMPQVIRTADGMYHDQYLMSRPIHR